MKSVDDGESVILGLNKFPEHDGREPDLFPANPTLQADQIERVRRFKADRDADAVRAALEDVGAAARGTQNVLVPMREALRRRATLGEVSDALREVFGVYHPARGHLLGA